MPADDRNEKVPLLARRRSMVRGIAALAAGGALMMDRKASAQEAGARNIEVLQVIQRQGAAARDQLIISVARPLDEAQPAQEDEFLGAQKAILTTLLGPLAEIPEAQRINYVCGTRIGLAIEFRNQGVALVPPPSIVVAEYSRPTPQIQPPAPTESLVDVLIDILFDTFGINTRIRGAIATIFRTGRISVLFNGLAEAVAQRNAALVALRAERLFAAIFGEETLVAIGAAVGRAELQRILGTIAARFVPFIGWALWIASFIYAIHKNWAKLAPHLR
jgi:hypothetical protein